MRGWNERRANVPLVDNYDGEFLPPFLTWVRENHPEIGDLNPAVAGEWVLSRRTEILAMTAAFAESRGVTLGQQ